MFIVILIIEFATTFLVYSQLFVPFAIGNIQDIQIYNFVIQLITFIISPISVLVGFYYWGKKLYLKSNLKSVITRLLVGAYLGQFLAITIHYLVGIYFIGGFNSDWLVYLSRIVSVSFIGVFFVSFTALAIANLTK
jgi:hypothetical protein